MASRISDEDRERVLELARGGMARNDIVKLTGVGAGSVTRICAAEGVSFDRAGTKAATDAKRADSASRRADLAAGLLDDIAQLRARLFAPYLHPIAVPGKGAELIQLDQPTPADQRALMSAVGVALKGHIDLDRHDSDQHGLDAVDAWLRSITGGAAGGGEP